MFPEGEACLSPPGEVCCLWEGAGATEIRLDQQSASQEMLVGTGLDIEISV